MATKGSLISDELLQLRELVKAADSIELKVTIPQHSYRPAQEALNIDPLEAQIRQVFFLDTPDLTLDKAGVVARARRVQGRDHDTVVKLRPVVPADLPAKLRKLPEFVVEVDALPGGYVCSASMKNLLPSTEVLPAVRGEKPLRKIFSAQQRAFFEQHAPEGIKLDDLSVLGPIFVLKMKVSPAKLGRKVVGEMWLYPDGTRIVELSTKCLPGEGLDVALQMRDFFNSKGVDLEGAQQTKTRAALEFFSNELRAKK